ncbi:MAG: protein kinase [Planctomycetota bacterium]|nr:protein kinase [Planctomycetota bacterium]
MADPKPDRAASVPPTLQGAAGGATPGHGPHPLSPLITSASDTARIGADRPLQVTVEIQDLCADKLLLAAPRISYEGRVVPALGGIPLLARLGRGGMGAVYLGVHVRLRKEVAVKILPVHLAEQQPELIDRLYREAQIAARIASPHLVAVLDVNQDQGLFYLIMEFVNGMSAGALLRHAKQSSGVGLAEAAALDICIGAAEGLAAAHAAGIIHRDIKPDNILIPKLKQGDGLDFAASRLADLGLARADVVGQSMTKSNAALGTPGYMAPEQGMSAKKAGKPADVFSLGATLYALLSGHAPFEGGSGMEVLLKTLQNAHSSVHQWRADISPATVALIDRCLQKDPHQRYVDGSALLKALKVSRAVLGESAPAQQHAVEQLTVLEKAAEVGLAVRDSDAEHTPAALPRASAPSAGIAARPETAAGPSVAAPAEGSRFVTRVVLCTVCVLLLAGGTLYAVLHWRDSQFRAELADRINDGNAAENSDSEKLAEAIAALTAFKSAHASRPPADLQGLDGVLAKLNARRTALAEREMSFGRLLARADALLPDDPDAALRTLADAEQLGKEDPSGALPELLSTLEPTLEQRRQKAREAKLAIETRAKRDRETQIQEAFGASYRKAAEAAQRVEWEAVQSSLKNALAALGTVQHPDRAAAETLLKTAEAQIEMRGRFEAKLRSAEELLATDPAAAKAAFQEAKAIWPEVPDSSRLQKGIAAAEAAVGQKRHEALMQQAQTDLLSKRWKDAEAAFAQALAERNDDARAKQGLSDTRYGGALERAEQVLAGKQWAPAEAAFNDVLALRADDPAAKDGVARAKAGASEERYQSAIKRGSSALLADDWKGAEEAFRAALLERKEDSDALRLLGQTQSKAADSRYAVALREGKQAMAGKDWQTATAALQRALKERGNDPEALGLLAQIADALKPKTPPPPPQPPQPAQPAFGPEKTYGPYGVYANRIQGVPLDKDGVLIPVQLDLDNEQYAEALVKRKSWLKVNQGAKVRIEASGRWFSGPTGAWVTPDGKHDDGREAIKSYRAFTGPDNSFNIAMLVVYLCEKEKPDMSDYAQISRAGHIWAYTGKPIEFIAPVTGTLRLQQNRNGYFDVTQGALSITVIVSEPSAK